MSAPPADLVDRLAQQAVLRGVPPAQIAWLAAHGRLDRYATGQVIYEQGAIVEGLHLVLSGQVAIHVDRGAGRRKVKEWQAGEAAGVLPYSRLRGVLGDVVAVEPTEFVTVPREHFLEMIRQCHELTTTLVHVMLDQVRHFTSSDWHDEKLVSLGKLAAGLAHELNNPASAITRSATGLTDGLIALEEASWTLGGAGLSLAQAAAVRGVREFCLTTPLTAIQAPLERADREDTLAAWLEERGADPAAAQPLAQTAITVEALDRLATMLDRAALDAALRWVAAGCATRQYASEIEQAATRIYGLVAAVKGFTRMDHATVPETVDIGRGLTDTLAVLQAKARSKTAGVTVQVAADLPTVQGFSGELNQVWMNLIDNALDAVLPGGQVEIAATHDGGAVLVRVVDDGPGIPPNIRARIFDPFFTTKPVGEGTGLGLDIARRLVQRHDGTIDVESRPGRTEFRVRLPVAAAVMSPVGAS